MLWYQPLATKKLHRFIVPLAAIKHSKLYLSLFFFFNYFIFSLRKLTSKFAAAKMAAASSSCPSFSRFYVSSRLSSPQFILFNLPHTGKAHARTGTARFKCSAGQTGFFTRIGRLIKEKAKSDVEKIFSGFSKTRNNLAVIDELLLYWNLADTDRVLDELEEVSVASF